MEIFLLVTSIILTSGCYGVDFTIRNNRGDPLWIGTQGGGGHQELEGGGFVLNGNQEITISAPDDWQGRFWARTGCDGNTNHCETGDCGNRLQCGGNGGAPPATLAEINLKADAGNDFYDLSLVDGYNLPATIAPVNGEGDCPSLGCTADVNGECPNELRQDSNGATVGCKSSCVVYNTDQYCCRNQYGTSDTCNINDWPVNSAQYFKSKCPDAYSYAYDDNSALKTCKASAYIITFG